MVVDGPRGFLTTSGILPFNVKLKPLCMGNRVGRRGKFAAGLLEKAVGDQGVERGNKQPMVSASYECTTIDMEMRRLLAGFHLPLDAFMCESLNAYGVAPGQLSY
ncbi:hypothetical protein Goshw_025989 [Gossypium schwendimanii]|uniref:Uncharacterized protein n=1 Tax=Gossypium schwendimanii TaxID=34291 RepID=A0A7J9MX65_GOSSC|nr:hypothetical protein [Gossypium schwendimanii]